LTLSSWVPGTSTFTACVSRSPMPGEPRRRRSTLRSRQKVGGFSRMQAGYGKSVWI
jgi:hypothetical protein